MEEDGLVESAPETEKLDLQMKKAVQDENYELAAKIRDRLAELKKANL